MGPGHLLVSVLRHLYQLETAGTLVGQAQTISMTIKSNASRVERFIRHISSYCVDLCSE